MTDRPFREEIARLLAEMLNIDMEHAQPKADAILAAVRERDLLAIATALCVPQAGKFTGGEAAAYTIGWQRALAAVKAKLEESR